MNDIGFWIVVTLIGMATFGMGWNLRAIYEHPKRSGLEAAAEEHAADEYERGSRDGFAMGVGEGMNATRRVLANQIVLTGLAKRRFVAGGLQPHE